MAITCPTCAAAFDDTPDHRCPECETLVEGTTAEPSRATLRAAFHRYVCDVATVRTRNTREWMEWFVEGTNHALEVLGERDRLRLDPRGMIRIDKAGL